MSRLNGAQLWGTLALVSSGMKAVCLFSYQNIYQNNFIWKLYCLIILNQRVKSHIQFTVILCWKICTWKLATHHVNLSQHWIYNSSLPAIHYLARGLVSYYNPHFYYSSFCFMNSSRCLFHQPHLPLSSRISLDVMQDQQVREMQIILAARCVK